MRDVSPEIMWESLLGVITELGFDYAGVAEVGMASGADAFLKWREAGFHADMEWLVRNEEKRVDARKVMPEAQAVIVLGMSYYSPGRTLEQDVGRFARYAWGDDYHEVLEQKLKDLDETLQVYGGMQRYYTDTGPILERDWAQEAVLGWQGKSGLLIHRGVGSYTFLAVILTTLELSEAVNGVEREPMRCGFCHRCIDRCPTGAIVSPHRVDARKCLSYLTIENKGAIPEEFRALMGNRIYGCDECLLACPWNRHPKVSSEHRFRERRRDVNLSLKEYLLWTEADFIAHFRHSPVRRVKWQGFMRNVCVAAGNVGDESYLPLLTPLCEGENDLVAEHATWAVAEIRKRNCASK